MYIPWNLFAGAALRQWKVIVAALVVFVAYTYGHSVGTNRQKMLYAKAELEAQERWQKQSQEYQQQIAAQRQKIRQKQKELNDAIRLSYAGCVANHDIVRVWNETHGQASR